MKPAPHVIFRFDEYTLDVIRGSLRTSDREVELRPKSFEVLCYLVENADRIVTKEELIESIWPDVVVTHIGGESSRQVKSLEMSKAGAQLVLWRMRSTLLYYRKHHGWAAWSARMLETGLYRLIVLRNSFSSDPRRQARVREHRKLIAIMDQAWQDTQGGRVSPPRPW